ncbi:Pyridine nucleotide-disulphide oxidoreductase [Kaistia soli DSM 19436]|uniref:Pyridine nucleotide-disulphide oxidoreductase n=1 Tax=Kaistia soli DSM 19436 TaxID=1122133 RepID=A0A1M5IJ69_9HYPH|nr:NAD(P)-binding domain-containing protein [Kaistia soli]SHG28388.1 Pyridine nucleotide-disulphide oxidoreductase [Kaistia soli DSM 19436]
MTAIFDSAAEARLAALAERARDELAATAFATKPWVTPRYENSERIADVAIIGGGQSGLFLGHALARAGVDNIAVLDRSPQGYEGVWETYARMHEIRSPKEVSGGEGAIPSLSVRSWFIARHGRAAWDAIERVPRTDWMAWLRWYRSVVDVPIENDIAVTDIDFDADGVTLETRKAGAVGKVRARLVVLATGMDGGGRWTVPSFIENALPPARYNHTSDIIDVKALVGKRIGILGAGAAAFDMAVAALVAGAASVDMFMRRPRLPLVDLVRDFETAGHLGHAHELSDETKWALSSLLGGLSQSPAEHHFNKAWSFDNFRMHLGSPWETIGMDGDAITVTTPKATFRFDHVVAATGVTVDMALRPELRRIAAHAALWRDRFVPPADDPAPGRLGFPYLNRSYQFQPRIPGEAPGIERIFAFNALGAMSMGGISQVSISSHKFGLPRLVRAITGLLFREQEAGILSSLARERPPSIRIESRIRAALGMAED